MKFQIAKTGWWRCGLVWALKDWESARRGDHRLIGFFMGPFYFTTR